ncbi:MAG TPA: Asp-tRNA(Asn)/Glu-tRNA(Gln) amidotransferase subunit GatC [Coxiellaceae bacterium]|nr:Asp-tRNA(Asn)/Glu-tRNA(Gln) amidotransferase subunit GatC [Coxiellaceae bacterium]
MAVNRETLERVLQLAKLPKPEKAQESQLLEQFNTILTLIHRLDQVNTRTIQPLSHPFDDAQPLREDRVTESDQREAFQAIAPHTKAGLYLVPKVIETEE